MVWMIVLSLEEVEALLRGEKVTRTYHSSMGLTKDDGPIPVTLQHRWINAGFGEESVFCKVRVLEHRTEQRGKGKQRPQYNHIYVYEAV